MPGPTIFQPMPGPIIFQPMPVLMIFQEDSAWSATSQPKTGLLSYGRTMSMRMPELDAMHVTAAIRRRATVSSPNVAAPLIGASFLRRRSFFRVAAVMVMSST